MNADIDNTDSMRAYRFRIYPDSKRQSEIDLQLTLSKEFYNLLLEKSIKSYKDGNRKVSMAILNKFAKEIEEDKKYLQIYSQTRCEIKYRILKAYQNFFRRVKGKKSGKHIKAGFPRFRSMDRYKSITYPQDNGSFYIEKERKTAMLRVSRIGRMKIELHRQMEGKTKTLTIKKEGGNYYAIFTAIKDAEIPKVGDINPVGVDVGLKTFAVLSDGTRITKPNFRKNQEKHIARWQRIVARRKKGSRRRQIAKERMNREYEVANSQTNDYLHKITDRLVNSGYTSFAVEKLQIQNMARNHRLAKAINYASWNRFFQFLSYKAESAGMKVTEVDPRNTSKACSNCGNIQAMPLSKRIYLCEGCGMQEDRDINASINILNRATAGLAGSHVQGDFVRPQQGAMVEELKTYSAKERNP
jgi:putative transposase